jgi:hypothetical protein
MIEAGLFNLLSGSSGIASFCDSRIYPVILPEDPQLPALTYQLISAQPSPTLTTSGMQRFRIQFDCWAETYADAVGLRAALTETLNGFQGTLNDGTALQDAQLEQVVDFFGDDDRFYRCMVEFILLFNFRS